MPRLTLQPAPAPAPIGLLGKRAYLVGIAGSGMSGLARLLQSRGAIVSGSDVGPSEASDALAGLGIEVGFDQSRAWIPDACDLVVHTAAVRPDHPQLLAAQDRRVPVMLYAEALGVCMQSATGVCIAGTHGKSTTTAMLGCALTDAGLDPSVIVGAGCRQLAAGCLAQEGDPAPVGFRLGAPQIPAGPLRGRPGILVAESCEYNRSFHQYRPRVASISSIEADHLDCYGTLEAVIESFRQFAALLPPASEGGKLLIAHFDAHRREVTAGVQCAVETIGFTPEADWVISYDPAERRVSLAHQRATVGEWTMSVPGAHNAFNASIALALGSALGADVQRLAASLSRFKGVDRRMQLLGVRELAGGPVRVIDDYGHHPTEVETTLRALRESERPEERGGRLICVFQPHQHSRTRHLLGEFANAFGHADVVIVPDIYFVRDSQEERQKVDAKDLVNRLREKKVRAMHLHPFDAIIEQLEHVCRPNDLLVVMGAGDVWKIGRAFVDAGAARPDALGRSGA